MKAHPNPNSNPNTSVRTIVADAILSEASAQLDATAAEAVLECGLSATTAAARNSQPLLDWEEYRHAGFADV